MNKNAKALQIAALATPTDLKPNAVRDIAGALNILLADMFALYLKTKNFHWHMSGPHFRDYHLLLDEHSEQIFATTDDIAERVRKIGGTTLRSIGHIGRLQRVEDNDADYVTPLDMLAELRDDNKELAANLRETHGLCDEEGDVATASLLENWIDVPGSCSKHRGAVNSQSALPARCRSSMPIVARRGRSRDLVDFGLRGHEPTNHFARGNTDALLIEKNIRSSQRL